MRYGRRMASNLRLSCEGFRRAFGKPSSYSVSREHSVQCQSTGTHNKEAKECIRHSPDCSYGYKAHSRAKHKNADPPHEPPQEIMAPQEEEIPVATTNIKELLPEFPRARRTPRFPVSPPTARRDKSTVNLVLDIPTISQCFRRHRLPRNRRAALDWGQHVDKLLLIQTTSSQGHFM
ncbi:hypothetical protein Sjap_024747 [Stephania japonica]|uniref:Uncharacterized protein n=1 Tax=Stephania japonica TaxID=461633 RepID=A0AAP0EDY0_9MAGN